MGGILRVNEIYDSIQGEGIYTGTPMTIVRLQGCSVGCSWCDSRNTWVGGGWGGEEVVVENLVRNHLRHQDVLLTVGECHRYPPSEGGRNRFPEVSASQFCGEWREREEV